MKILDIADDVYIDLGVGGDLVNMTAGKKLVRRSYPGFLDRHSRLEQPFHALAHRRRICISIEPCPLQGETASVQVPRIRQYNGCFEQTVTAFLTEIVG